MKELSSGIGPLRTIFLPLSSDPESLGRLKEGTPASEKVSTLPTTGVQVRSGPYLAVPLPVATFCALPILF